MKTKAEVKDYNKDTVRLLAVFVTIFMAMESLKGNIYNEINGDKKAISIGQSEK